MLLFEGERRFLPSESVCQLPFVKIADESLMLGVLFEFPHFTSPVLHFHVHHMPGAMLLQWLSMEATKAAVR